MSGKYYVVSVTNDCKIPLGNEILETDNVLIDMFISYQKNKISNKTEGAFETCAINRLNIDKLNSKISVAYIDVNTGQKNDCEESLQNNVKIKIT